MNQNKLREQLLALLSQELTSAVERVISRVKFCVVCGDVFRSLNARTSCCSVICRRTLSRKQKLEWWNRVGAKRRSHA